MKTFEDHLRKLAHDHGGRFDAAAAVRGPSQGNYGGDVILTMAGVQWLAEGNAVTPLTEPVPPADDRRGTGADYPL